jgi:hypothetical protein
MGRPYRPCFVSAPKPRPPGFAAQATPPGPAHLVDAHTAASGRRPPLVQHRRPARATRDEPDAVRLRPAIRRRWRRDTLPPRRPPRAGPGVPNSGIRGRRPPGPHTKTSTPQADRSNAAGSDLSPAPTAGAGHGADLSPRCIATHFLPASRRHDRDDAHNASAADPNKELPIFLYVSPPVQAMPVVACERPRKQPIPADCQSIAPPVDPPNPRMFLME